MMVNFDLEVLEYLPLVFSGISEDFTVDEGVLNGCIVVVVIEVATELGVVVDAEGNDFILGVEDIDVVDNNVVVEDEVDGVEVEVEEGVG